MLAPMAEYNRKDHLYKKAKEDGFRSRATYKLEELDKKHSLIKRGMRVLDLGAWPGGWLQYIASRIGEDGLAVGLDLVQIEDLSDPRISLITGDAREEETIQKALAFAGGKFDLVVSDMSPKLSGIKEADQAASVGLVELALYVCSLVLKNGGTFVCKVFKGNETEVFVKNTRPLFNKLVRTELDSTRKTSNEFYLVCLGYK